MKHTQEVPLHFVKDMGPLLEVKDIMSKPVTIVPQITVALAIQKMKKHGISCLVVAGKNQRVSGILTEKDILYKVIIAEEDPTRLKVSKIMTSPVLTIPLDTTVLAAGRLMSRSKIRRLVVAKNNRLQGIITQTDVAHVISSFGIWKDVRDIMTKNIVTVPSELSVSKAAKLMKFKNVSSVAVVKSRKIIGMLTEKDFIRKIAAKKIDATQLKVKDIMSAPIISITPSFSVFNACRLMEKHKIRRILVIVNSLSQGILTRTDIFSAFDLKLKMFENEYFEALNKVPFGFFITDPSLRVKFVNKAFLEIFGIKKITDVIDNLLLPPPRWERAEKRKVLLGILNRKRALDCDDVSFRDVSGNVIHLAVYCLALKKIEGDIMGYQGVMVNKIEAKEIEQTLIDSEERFRTIFEESPVSLWLEDFSKVKEYIDALQRKGVKDFRKYFEKNPKSVHKCANMVKVVDVNKTTLKLFRIKIKKEFLGSLGKIFARETFPIFKEELVALAEGKTTFESKATTQRFSEGRDDIILKMSVVPGSEKTLSKVLVSITDLRERKQAQEAMLAAYKFTSGLVENAPFGVFTVDKQGLIDYVNLAMLKISGSKQDKFIGMNVFKIPTYVKTGLSNKIKQCFAGKSFFIGHLEYTSYYGRKKSIRNFTGIPRRNEAGAIEKVIIFVEDITKVEEAEEKYKILYESSRDAIMTLVPPSWKFTSGNPATVEMFKVRDEKQFISLCPWEVSPKYQPDGQLSSVKSKKMIMKAMEEGSNFFEWTHTRYKGEDFPATILLTRIKLEGKQLLQATFRDITKQKRAEQAVKKRTEELEKFHKLAVGRELAMVELKKKVKELEEKLRSR